jgi:membrane-bound metal-dependent hydrolase YbcI (DUF457 family)
MDNISHTMIGIALSRLGPMRAHPTAPVLLMLAANVPDVDAYGLAVDSYAYLAHHRGYGHALITAPLLALACVLLCKVVLGTRLHWSTWAFSLIAVLTHDVLDWTNPYGVRWLLPWSGEWFSLGTTMAWDPVIVVLLVFTAAMPALLRLIDAWLSNVKVQRPGAGWAWIALAGLVLYGGIRWGTQATAMRTLAAQSYRPPDIEEMALFPTTSSLTGWRGLVRVDGAVYELPFDLTKEFPYTTRLRLPLPDAELTRYIAAARTSRTAQAIEALNPVLHWEVSAKTHFAEVRMIDARFGTLAEPKLLATMKVRTDGKVMTERLEVGAGVY